MTLPEQAVLPAVEEGGASAALENPGGKSDGSAVVLRGLHKSFGRQTVLDGITVTVTKGETLAVLGRSGTGKSVLLKLIIGLQKPDAGSILIHGEEITKLPLDAMNEIRKKMGFLFQNAALYDSLTVEQNIAFPLQRHSKKTEAEQGLRSESHQAAAAFQRKHESDGRPSQRHYRQRFGADLVELPQQLTPLERPPHRRAQHLPRK